MTKNRLHWITAEQRAPFGEVLDHAHGRAAAGTATAGPVGA
jgi:hypothetical protein